VERREDIEGKTFRAEESLVGWVTSPERYLFYPDFRTRKIQKPIFGKNISAVKNIGTFFCYPLVSGSEFLGSLTLTFEEDHALPEYERNALTTLARMAATSISNAYLHDRVARMATTDGLTGLYNHRYFQERLSERIEEARRHPTRHSLVLVDIDHFKKVNDTYGHPVGDEVLKRLAVLLKESVRR
jgi:GAF domain-containing protein